MGAPIIIKYGRVFTVILAAWHLQKYLHVTPSVCISGLYVPVQTHNCRKVSELDKQIVEEQKILHGI